MTSSHVMHLDRNGSRVATIVFPRDWVEPVLPWLHTEIFTALDLERGKAYVAGGVLDDGTTLVGLVYPGGQRVLRSFLEGGIDEHFSGRPLTDADGVLVELWRSVVASWVESGRFVRDLRSGL